ncbi:MAG: hypothetical protein KDA42_13850 [Planctomycetales bacterium]|nr:hypothetical protein [Planctomycetales bacterium]
MRSPASKERWGRWFGPLLLMSCLLPALLPLAGCSCTKDPSELTEEEKKKKLEELAKKKEKEKPNFELEEIELQPGDRDRKSGLRARWLKPGHWLAARQEMLANNFNFVGELEASVVESKTGQPIQLSNTAFRMTTTRPVALTKAQKKHLDMMLFVPPSEGKTTRVSATLHGKRFGEEVVKSPGLFTAMEPYQYHFIVLARNPDIYRNLSNLESIRATWYEQNTEIAAPHYRVIFPAMTRPVQLPQSSLCWTSTAYVLWDDFDPELLSYEQQQALVDWLHWGGQLLVSGPDSLDTLRGSFLKSYLPATSEQAAKLSAADLGELDRRWTPVPIRGSKDPLRVTVPWTALDLKPTAGSQVVPGSNDLLVERQVGRGRIVLSAVRLYSRDLTTWSGWDNFFNNCLLRRPARRFNKTDDLYYDKKYTVDWADGRLQRHDSALISNVRYFSRDAGREKHEVASWSTVNPVPNAARDALRQAAGIEVPKAQFVVWCVAAYLLVLVPLNWGLFSALGGVEWAWVAAPIVAIICSVLVVRIAQLDIGFARAQTEIAVLEAHGGYRRAHVSRYTALYTSLSSTYDLHFDSPDSVALPFPKETNFRLSFGQQPSVVTYDRGADVTLSGVQVSSNTTEMVHSEQMLDLGGPIELRKNLQGRPVVHNGSRHDLVGVGILQNMAAPGEPERLASCWIGSLPADEVTQIAFAPVANPDDPFGEISHRTTALGESPQSVGRLDGLSRGQLEPGEMRLIGRVDKMVDGLHIEPASSQIRATTIVIVHLKSASWDAPQSDANGPGKQKKQTTQDLEEQLRRDQEELRREQEKNGPPIPNAY